MYMLIIDSNTINKNKHKVEETNGKKIHEISKVNNGNRSEWSPIRSVIIHVHSQVINKMGRPRSGSPIC